MTFRVFFTLLLLQWTHALEWSYEGDNGPSHWSAHYPDCDLQSQSPIDIVSSEATESEDLTEFLLDGYETNEVAHCTLLNNGHTVQVNLPTAVSISGGGLHGSYKAEQFHFHWGNKTTRGSEHMMDGVQYPMELHIVHYTDHREYAVAANTSEGLAVMSFMFEVGSADNEYYTDMINAFTGVSYAGAQTTWDMHALRSLLPSNLNTYYRYLGSLTTPPCYESVIWTVFADTIKISENQLDAFRALHETNNPVRKATDGAANYNGLLIDNFRPTQQLNGRKIYKNCQMYCSATTTLIPVWSFLATIVMTTASLIF